MNDKKITCIVCPIGCKILVKTDGKKLELIEGNKCKSGIDYARSEALNPERMLTSSVLVLNGKWPLVSVRTTKPVPRDKIFEILKELKKVNINAPVKIGQIIIRNVNGTNIDIISTKTINKL